MLIVGYCTFSSKYPLVSGWNKSSHLNACSSKDVLLKWKPDFLYGMLAQMVIAGECISSTEWASSRMKVLFAQCLETYFEITSVVP